MSTPAQRALLINLLREAELPLDVVTLMHTRIPHCGRDWYGRNVDVWLSCLSTAQASDAIEFLQGELS